LEYAAHAACAKTIPRPPCGISGYGATEHRRKKLTLFFLVVRLHSQVEIIHSFFGNFFGGICIAHDLQKL
jgi:hypothetical protein